MAEGVVWSWAFHARRRRTLSASMGGSAEDILKARLERVRGFRMRPPYAAAVGGWIDAERRRLEALQRSGAGAGAAVGPVLAEALGDEIAKLVRVKDVKKGTLRLVSRAAPVRERVSAWIRAGGDADLRAACRSAGVGVTVVKVLTR